jgi:hypothetical protein
MSKTFHTTIGKFADATWDWQWANKGPFTEPFFDYEAELAKLIAQGASPVQIALALGLVGA